MVCGPCGGVCGCGDSLHASEKLARCCAMSAIVSSIVIILLFSVAVGIGLGYNFCLTKKRADDAEKLMKETQTILFATSTEIDFDRFEEEEEEHTTQIKATETTTEDIVYEDVTYVFAGWAGAPFQSEAILIKPHHLTLKRVGRLGYDNEPTAEELIEKTRDELNATRLSVGDLDYYDPIKPDQAVIFNNTNMTSLVEYILSQKDNVSIKFVQI